MTSVTVYGGAGEIGGNKILVDDGGWSVLLDFGMSFKRHGMFFEEFLKPRGGRGLVDYLELGLLPRLRGLYRTDLEPPGAAVWAQYPPVPFDRARLRGVILSHAHLDHSADISFLDPAIPIFCGPVTAFLAKGVQDSGKSSMAGEVVYATDRVPYEPEKNLIEAAVNAQRVKAGLGLLKSSSSKFAARVRPFYFTAEPSGAGAEAFWQTSPGSRGVDGVAWQAASAVWKSALRLLPVDHSIPGACACLLETSAGPLAYSGDIRLQGRAAGDTRAFAAAAAALNGVTLLCEGTRLGKERESGTAAQIEDDRPAPTEEEVAANCLEAVQAAKGTLVVADFGPRNVERLQSFLGIAEATDRLLVVLDKDAYLLQALAAVGFAGAPAPDHPRLRVFNEPTTNPGAWRRDSVWAQLQDRLITARAIGDAPGDYIVCFSFFQTNDLVDIRPDGGIYIYSTSEPYDDEQKLDLKRLREWLKHFEMTLVGDPEVKGQARYHASGHAPEADLRWVVETIRPKRLIPIHTEHPEWFTENFDKRHGGWCEVIEPKVGVPIPLG